jgi:hypothetical protein
MAGFGRPVGLDRNFALHTNSARRGLLRVRRLALRPKRAYNCSQTERKQKSLHPSGHLEPAIGTRLSREGAPQLVPPISRSCSTGRTLIRNVKSKSGTRIIYLLVPLCFRSSCQKVPPSITNFGKGALGAAAGSSGCVTHRLNAVAVRIEHECAVVMRMIMRTQPRRPVVLTAGGQCRPVKRIDASSSRKKKPSSKF